MTVWSNLPNAAYIDSIIESLKLHSEVWTETCLTTGFLARNKVWSGVASAALTAAWRAALSAARDAALSAALSAIRDTVRYAAWHTAWDARKNAAIGAVVALTIYDDSAKYLDMTSDELKVWALLSEDPAAVLLLPAVIAYEQIMELETL